MQIQLSLGHISTQSKKDNGTIIYKTIIVPNLNYSCWIYVFYSVLISPMFDYISDGLAQLILERYSQQEKCRIAKNIRVVITHGDNTVVAGCLEINAPIGNWVMASMAFVLSIEILCKGQELNLCMQTCDADSFAGNGEWNQEGVR